MTCVAFFKSTRSEVQCNAAIFLGNSFIPLSLDCCLSMRSNILTSYQNIFSFIIKKTQSSSKKLVVQTKMVENIPPPVKIIWPFDVVHFFTDLLILASLQRSYLH